MIANIKKFKGALSLLITLFLFLSYIPTIQGANAATSQYAINYHITYTVGSDGATKVDYLIQLTNLTDSVYAASQSLTTTQTDITNLNVYDIYGTKEQAALTKGNGESTVTTTFTNPAIGNGSSNTWHITYTTKQIAEESGGVWDVIVPGFSNLNALNINNLEIDINTPTVFGSLSYASPSPAKSQSTNGTNTYVFTRNQINAAGISLILGKAETYAFSFNYPVKASSGNNTYTIAVPPDTASQQVIFTDISPKPSNFAVNKDGDYILTYSNLQSNISAIHVSGLGQVASTYTMLTTPLSSPVYLPATEVSALTAASTYWQTSNPEIKSLAASLTKGETDPVLEAKSIYTYIVTHFQYNKDALYDPKRTRKGALYAIQHPDDVICQEYVDAFVALARSAGIPAVFDAGYGDTASPLNTLPPDVLHAWAEFYSPQYGWVPVDPTWASTSGLDFFGNLGTSHFLVAQYGYSAANPPLVLSFSAEKNPANNIKLAPTNNSFTSHFAVAGSGITATGGLTSTATLGLTNTGNSVLHVSGTKLSFNGKSVGTTASSAINIFPTMTGNIFFTVHSGNIFTAKTYKGLATITYVSEILGSKTISLPVSVHIVLAWFIQAIPLVAVILIFVISYGLVNLSIRLYHRIAK